MSRTVKKMIEDHKEMCEKSANRLNEIDEEIEEYKKKLTSLSHSYDLIEDTTTRFVIHTAANNISEILKCRQRTRESYETEHNNNINSRTNFMKIMQMNCCHDWIFDFTDGHNGEDHYHCSVCYASS